MQEIFTVVYNPKRQRHYQMLIRPINGWSTHFRLEYGVILVTMPRKLFLSEEKRQDIIEKNLPVCFEKIKATFFSSIFFPDETRGFAHILGTFTPFENISDFKKHLSSLKRKISKLLHKIIVPMIDKHLQELGIEGITYNLSISSSYSYVGRLSFKKTQPVDKRFSFKPEEIKGMKFTFSFNWMLGMFAPDIVESVVVHEVVHCLERHHNKNFYDLVYKLCPSYNYYSKCLFSGYVRGDEGELKCY